MSSLTSSTQDLTIEDLTGRRNKGRVIGDDITVSLYRREQHGANKTVLLLQLVQCMA